MNAGRLDRLVSIQYPTISTDSFGASGAITWTTLTTQMWARMETSLSSESVSADKVESTYPVKWTMRYSTQINESMRIVYERQNYVIKGIREVTRRHLIEVQTELVS